MGMFDKFAGIPADVTGFRKLAAAVKAKKVKNKDAKAALRAIAAERTTVEGTKLGKALAACEAGEWKPKKGDDDATEAKSPEPKAKAKAKSSVNVQTGGARLFSDLSGLERHRALKREAKHLDLDASGKADVLEARIREALAEGMRLPKAPAKAKRKTVKVAKAKPAAKPSMPSPEVLRGAMEVLNAFLANVG